MSDLIKVIRMNPPKPNSSLFDADRICIPWQNAVDGHLLTDEMVSCSCKTTGTDLECASEGTLCTFFDLICRDWHCFKENKSVQSLNRLFFLIQLFFLNRMENERQE